MTSNIPYFEDAQSKLVAGLATVERDAINAIVYNPQTNLILCLNWPKFGWKTFIIGGIEKDEDPINAARREITEETGYVNLKYINEVGRTRSGYFAAHKNENRISNAVGLVFELIDEIQRPTHTIDTQHHNFVWIPKNEVASYINLSSQQYLWNNFLKLPA